MVPEKIAFLASFRSGPTFDPLARRTIGASTCAWSGSFAGNRQYDACIRSGRGCPLSHGRHDRTSLVARPWRVAACSPDVTAVDQTRVKHVSGMFERDRAEGRGIGGARPRPLHGLRAGASVVLGSTSRSVVERWGAGDDRAVPSQERTVAVGSGHGRGLIPRVEVRAGPPPIPAARTSHFDARRRATRAAPAVSPWTATHAASHASWTPASRWSGGFVRALARAAVTRTS